MVFICAPLGMHCAQLLSAKTGRDYEASPYLEVSSRSARRLHGHVRLSHPEIATATIRSTAS
jgi:hypothetical protein